MKKKQIMERRELERLQKAVTMQSNLMRDYLKLLQSKFEIRIPAQLTIGNNIFNVVLVDKDNMPIQKEEENKEPQQLKQKDLYKELGLSYIG